ncbi:MULTISPECIES: hypothetical protein [Enterobacteriaceae]|mgnify:CR=1 FL=1|jgi:hypothetical protein|nr:MULTISPECIES: hypothetical protein [Enterobacteriaceae]AWC83350.1 hypothetical protein AM410_02465 [Enterobacter cloacae complex sp. FDA-CDC-AR_0164]MBV2198851.1 hypothetical protein [Klebsiella variicola]MDD9251636.1 hypothetical protein [Klebsiella variicola]SHL54699.1 hypothetical protein SAMN05428986_0329 [Enterobacter ludwigii]HDS7658389.1 hypothetical protein [Klebsiella variicola]
MFENNKLENKSTELFLDLAMRSFEASWEYFQEVNGESIELLDDPDFMSLFIMYIIDHIQNNFERFTTQEGNGGDIGEVNVEQVAEMLVRYSDSFRK